MAKVSTSVAFDAVATRSALRRWYRANGRHTLPWRLTRDPYAVLVSEVMLQQTQVERVLPYYTAWLERWPTFEALAEASAADVIRAWRGLGYNRRALNLHRLAVEVAACGGELPREPSVLRALPGIGPYTESAIRCFARGETVAVADTNIARVLARLVCGAAGYRQLPPGEVAGAAAVLLPSRGARDHNLALMDLGAMVCTARSPRCGECPVSRACAWRALGYPVAEAETVRTPKFETTARFARGRIVDHLREAPATEGELAAILPAVHRPKLGQYLAALARDGLITRVGADTVALPH